MGLPRLILCNGILSSEIDRSDDGRHILELNAHGSEGNVNIKITDIAKTFAQSLSPRLLDLLEIASYVYATDCAANRGDGFSNNRTVESWGRDFKFVIPVEDTVFWQRKDVDLLLRRILNFLADDRCSFEFRPFIRDKSIQNQGYLKFFDRAEPPFQKAKRVIMFFGRFRFFSRSYRNSSKRQRANSGKPQTQYNFIQTSERLVYCSQGARWHQNFAHSYLGKQG